MAMNHGDDPNAFDKFKKFKPNFGATGEYPDGKLGKDDEGAITFGVTSKFGKVILNFGKPVAWLGMTPDQAMELGTILVARSQAARLLPGLPRRYKKVKS